MTVGSNAIKACKCGEIYIAGIRTLNILAFQQSVQNNRHHASQAGWKFDKSLNALRLSALLAFAKMGLGRQKECGKVTLMSEKLFF